MFNDHTQYLLSVLLHVWINLFIACPETTHWSLFLELILALVRFPNMLLKYSLYHFTIVISWMIGPNRFKLHQWRGCAEPKEYSQWMGSFRAQLCKWGMETLLQSKLLMLDHTTFPSTGKYQHHSPSYNFMLIACLD